MATKRYRKSNKNREITYEDLKDLDFIEQQEGVHQAREKEKITLKANHDKKSRNEIKEKVND